MTRQRVFFGVALVLLGAAAVLVAAPPRVSDVPLARTFDAMPSRVADWAGVAGAPADVLQPDPHAREQLRMTYSSGDRTLWASVEYYPAQTEGRRPPTRDLLFPRQGWTDLSERLVRVPLDGPAGGSVPANLVLVRAGERRLGIFYWYHAHGTSVASDHWYRALVLYNRLVHRRTDGALIRIVVPVGGGATPDAVLEQHGAFVRAFYLEILRVLPG